MTCILVAFVAAFFGGSLGALILSMVVAGAREDELRECLRRRFEVVRSERQ